MGIVAGFLVQNALKLMLSFGTVSSYLGYIALREHFPQMALKPNPECTSYWCRKQQEAHRVRTAEAAKNSPPPPPSEPEEAVELHASNEWGIEVDFVPEHELDAERPNPALRRYPSRRCPTRALAQVDDDDDDDDDDASSPGVASASVGAVRSQLAEGVQYAHVSSSQLAALATHVKKDEHVGAVGEVDLGDLIAQLKGIQS